MDIGKNFPKLPDEEAERCMYELTAEKLEAAGYLQYEVSNYAKRGMRAGITRDTGRGWSTLESALGAAL